MFLDVLPKKTFVSSNSISFSIILKFSANHQLGVRLFEISPRSPETIKLQLILMESPTTQNICYYLFRNQFNFKARRKTFLHFFAWPWKTWIVAICHFGEKYLQVQMEVTNIYRKKTFPKFQNQFCSFPVEISPMHTEEKIFCPNVAWILMY